MLGRKSGQLQMVMIDMESFVPEKHLLREINRHIDFEFIYDATAPYYSKIGRPSVDPVCMMKMLLVGYLYGVKSERRLVEEVTLNIGYRWFCGFELTDKIPDHSLFSQNRRRRFTDSSIFNEIFNHVVRECVRQGIVSGENVVSDGSFIPANVSASSIEETERVIEKSTVRYMEELDEELRGQPGYKEPTPTPEKKTIVKSITDTECGYISQENKKGLGYLTEMTVETGSGIVLGVDCYPANQRESSIILEHIGRIKRETGVSIDKLGLDAGYDVGAVHRGLEILGVTGYVSCIEFSGDVVKRGLSYHAESDYFECESGKRLDFIKLVYKKSTQNYYRLYRMAKCDRKLCQSCEKWGHCAFSFGDSRINVSAFYPSFHRNRTRYETPAYKAMKRLRGIWAEGTFAVLKREHNLAKATKRGLQRVKEECLLSALALNLKRIVKALNKPQTVPEATVFGFFLPFWSYIIRTWRQGKQSNSPFVNTSNIFYPP